jgi:hypothetical protein
MLVDRKVLNRADMNAFISSLGAVRVLNPSEHDSSYLRVIECRNGLYVAIRQQLAGGLFDLHIYKGECPCAG